MMALFGGVNPVTSLALSAALIAASPRVDRPDYLDQRADTLPSDERRLCACCEVSR